MKTGLEIAFQSRRSIARTRAFLDRILIETRTIRRSMCIQLAAATTTTRAVAAASGRTRTASDSDRRRIARVLASRVAADFTLRERKNAFAA